MSQEKKTTTQSKSESTTKMTTEMSLADTSCFIEHQFPVAKISAESFREREAKQGQLLTGLGKWWGRKPLVLVRAAILGLLLPATDEPKKDRDIFLKLMTMDEKGLWHRKKKRFPLPMKLLYAELPDSMRDQIFAPGCDPDKPKYRKKLSSDLKEQAHHLLFDRLSYTEKLTYCHRPEQMEGLTSDIWDEVNQHLRTSASSLPDLVEELGQHRFGRCPYIGDAFCGAGSIPFEAAQIGCDTYGSDLNPVATLMTWGSLNIIGGGKQAIEDATQALKFVFDAVNQQICSWGIEYNEQGWRADYYLYCVEANDPESGYRIPLAPSWIIGQGTRTIAQLYPDHDQKRFDLRIKENASKAELDAAKKGTVRDSMLYPPNNTPGEPHTTPILIIRGDGKDPTQGGLRPWSNRDIVPAINDVFGERLYCIRWVETYYVDSESGEEVWVPSESEPKPPSNIVSQARSGLLKMAKRRHYRSPTEADFRREQHVVKLLMERFESWQSHHIIPTRKIEAGVKTNEPIRTRGWTHWHHLYTPRQLLTIGLMVEKFFDLETSIEGKVAVLLAIGRCADWNSRLCRWNSDAANEKTEQTFTNQALNTLYNFGNRTLISLDTTWWARINSLTLPGTAEVTVADCREVNKNADLWITDPPYADAIKYEEISELILCWYEGLHKLFPGWPVDTRRALAIRDDDGSFSQSMVKCYSRLAECMPDNGLQVVMFTHQDAGVWADLATILWAAGLHVTAAWCIQTEREAAGTRIGNYVQGTVLMVLRKRTCDNKVFLDEVSHRVEIEVRKQLDTMLELEDNNDPNFADTDYQLAAYAAALRVLTERPIEEIDPSREILRQRPAGEISPVEQLIRNAVKIACDHLVPDGINREVWKTFLPMERFYIKGLEVETHGEYRSGVYQELARGFGAADYTDLLQSDRANQTRLKTAIEFGRRMLSGDGFGGSLVRQVLFAVYQIIHSEQTLDGLNWLKTELPDYWNVRDKILLVLEYLGKLDRVSGMSHWSKDSESARLLAGAVRNDHI